MVVAVPSVQPRGGATGVAIRKGALVQLVEAAWAKYVFIVVGVFLWVARSGLQQVAAVRVGRNVIKVAHEKTPSARKFVRPIVLG